jgi:hypothetical protein
MPERSSLEVSRRKSHADTAKVYVCFGSGLHSPLVLDFTLKSAEELLFACWKRLFFPTDQHTRLLEFVCQVQGHVSCFKRSLTQGTFRPNILSCAVVGLLISDMFLKIT